MTSHTSQKSTRQQKDPVTIRRYGNFVSPTARELSNEPPIAERLVNENSPNERPIMNASSFRAADGRFPKGVSGNPLLLGEEFPFVPTRSLKSRS
jgi:hypothetical protein